MVNNKIKEKRGAAMLTVVMLSLFTGLLIAHGVTSPVAREARVARELNGSKNSFIVAEALEEDVIYRVKNAMNYDSTETLELNGYHATSTIVDNAQTSNIEVTTRGEGNAFVRKKYSELSKGDRVEFNYGVQIGNGGLEMYNQSSVRGNVYANGSIVAFSDNLVYGSVTSAESAGLVDGVHATGTVRSNTIQDSTVEEDAYYQNISGTTVFGDLYPGSEDQPAQEFPITDETLDSWEQIAEEGGIISPAPEDCPYVIDEDATIGPVKITCGLRIRLGPTVTLGGMVWVEGDIDVENSATIRLDPALGAKSVAMIADDQSNRTTSSKIILRNSINFEGSGQENSYIMLISRNDDAEFGSGTEKAIEFQQTASGDVLVYSNHGEIEITNNSELRELTGYKIIIRNSAELIYEEGLASSLFETGPGGSWDVIDWRETE